MSNPLDPILAWYTTAKDAMRVTRRVIQKATPGIVTNRHAFHGNSPAANEAALDQALEELNRLTVLALTASFERTIRDHLLALPVIAPASADPLHGAVRDEILKDIEFWNISPRVVELFAMVDPALRGQVKQIIEFRNWVAHGKSLSRPSPSNTTPAMAYRRLTDFLTQAKVI